jgi:hypothetical protein
VLARGTCMSVASRGLAGVLGGTACPGYRSRSRICRTPTRASVLGPRISAGRPVNIKATGLTDDGRTSKLHNPLQRRGPIRNAGLGQLHGDSNAWLLTPYGPRVAEVSGYRYPPDAPSRGYQRDKTVTEAAPFVSWPTRASSSRSAAIGLATAMARASCASLPPTSVHRSGGLGCPRPVTSVHPCWGRWSQLGGAVASDRRRGFSRRRAQAPIAHYLRGR